MLQNAVSKAMGKGKGEKGKKKNPEKQTHSCFDIAVHKDFYLKYGRSSLPVAHLWATPQVTQMLVALIWLEGEKASGTKGKCLANANF